MKVESVYKCSNGNEILIYTDEDGWAELYYHDYINDTDTFIAVA